MSVKRALTPRREREIPEYAGFVRRSIRGHGRRVGKADPEDLVGLLELRDVVEEAIRDAVEGQRRAGFSWAQIARPLGMSRQAVQQRYGVSWAEARQSIREAQEAYWRRAAESA